LLGYKNVPHLWVTELTRVFRGIKTADRVEAIAFADKYISVLNTAEIAAGTTARSVTNPLVDKIVAPGVWRLVRTEAGSAHANPDTLGVVEVLARGWTQTLVADGTWTTVGRSKNQLTAPGNTDAASHNPERLLVVEFPFCDPGYEKTLVETLGAATTFATITLADGIYGGPWYPRQLTTERAPDDGTVTLLLTLSRETYQLTGVAESLSSETQKLVKRWGVPKTSAQAVMAEWIALYPGCTVVPTYNEDRHLVNLELRYSDPTPQSGSGIWPSSGEQQYSDRYADTDRDTTREVRVRASSAPVMDEEFDEEGRLVETGNEVRSDGRFNTRREQTDSKVQIVPEHVARVTATSVERQTRARNLRSSSAELAELTVAERVPVVIETVEVDKNPDKTLDALKRAESAVDVMTQNAFDNALEIGLTEEHTAVPTAAPLTAGVGQAVESEEAPTEFPDRVRRRDQTRTGKDVVTTGRRETALETVSSEEHSCLSKDALPSSEPGDGQLVVVETDPTQYVGKVRARKDVSDAVDVETHESREDAFEKTDVVRHTASSGEAALPDPLPSGEEHAVSNVADDHKNRFRTTASKTVGKPVDSGPVIVERDDYTETTWRKTVNQPDRPVLTGVGRMRVDLNRRLEWTAEKEQVAPLSGLLGTVRRYTTWGSLTHMVSSAMYYTSARMAGVVVSVGASGAETLYAYPKGDNYYVAGIDSVPQVIIVGKWRMEHVVRYHATEEDAIAAVDAGGFDGAAAAGASRWQEEDGDYSRLLPGLWRSHKVTKKFVTFTDGVHRSLTEAYTGPSTP
jgi:hypothetical protein